MCDALETLLKEELIPFVETAKSAFEREGDFDRQGDMEELLETFDEILADIASGLMEAWECGELHDEFRRYRESGDFLGRIS
ncbi:hypothetical protein [Hydrogenimonas sp.]